MKCSRHLINTVEESIAFVSSLKDEDLPKSANFIEDPSLLSKPPIRPLKTVDSVDELTKMLRRIDKPILNYTAVSPIGWERLGVRLSSRPEAQKDWLATALMSDFSDASVIGSAVMTVGDPTLLVQRHVSVLCELSDFLPDSSLFTELCVIHCYICSYFNLVDSCVDGHTPRIACLDAGPLLLAALDRIRRLNLTGSSSFMGQESRRLLHSLMIQKRALTLESSHRKRLIVNDQLDEKDAIVGRADCVFFMVDLVAAISGKSLSPSLRQALKDYVFLSQLADDLGDWRNDYRLGNFTPFLRDCFALHGQVLAEDALERIIYLEGLYETELVRIIRLMNILMSEHKSETERMRLSRSVVVNERMKMESILRAFVRTKYWFSNSHVAA